MLFEIKNNKIPVFSILSCMALWGLTLICDEIGNELSTWGYNQYVLRNKWWYNIVPDISKNPNVYNTISFVCIFIMLLIIFYNVYVKCTYISVYSDHIEGKAIHGFFIKKIYIKNEQIINVTQSTKKVNFCCSDGIYSTFAKKELANMAFNHYNKNN